MEFERLRICLDYDFHGLRDEVAAADPSAQVPTCPDWSIGDLAHHVAEVYWHKAECIRLGAFPDPWPPETINPDPATALDECYAALAAQFDAHRPADHAATWHEPNQTVGFWIRRMAQETVIHLFDAKLATGSPFGQIPDDLASDGIDELLTLFIAFASVSWRAEFGDLLDAPDERPVAVRAGDRAWSVRVTKGGVLVEEITGAAAVEPAAATVTGTPHQVLLWLWNRADDTTLTLDGDPVLLDQFHAVRVAGTQ